MTIRPHAALALTLALAGAPAWAQPTTALVPVSGGAAQIALNAFASDEVAFNLPGGERAIGYVTRRSTHELGTENWEGILAEQEGGWFSVAASGGVAHAYIDAGGLGVYEVKSRGDGSGLYDTIRVDTMEFEPCAGAVSPAVAERGIPGVLERAMLQERAETGSDRGAALARGAQVIDVMIVYTAEARAGEGGTNGIQALAQNSINISNTAYANSEINGVQLNLVHVEEIVYSETDNPSTDLNRLRGTTDGFMDGVHATRDAVGADLVALLVDDMGPACGIAYLAPTSPSLGFSVTDADCAVGNLSFPHEIGHNQGATHDIANAGGAVYSFGYGWRWFGTNGVRYRSVMAYSPGSRVPYFSNPDVNYVGTPTGTATADNAQVIELTAASVSSFRQLDVPLSFSFPNGLPSDLTPGEPVTITVEINEGTDGPLNASTAFLFYGYDVVGQPFQFVPLTNTTGQTWEAQLPGGACSQTASFYVSVTNTDLETFNSPSDPTAPYTAGVTDCVPACVADTNADGSLTPADFNAWILAFNSQAPACDQNDDGQCTPADFNAWILNYNAGC